jgi:hypothetical protein
MLPWFKQVDTWCAQEPAEAMEVPCCCSQSDSSGCQERVQVSSVSQVISASFGAQERAEAMERVLAVEVLHALAGEGAYGSQVAAQLDASEVWAAYRDQRHDLFLPAGATAQVCQPADCVANHQPLPVPLIPVRRTLECTFHCDTRPCVPGVSGRCTIISALQGAPAGQP